MCCDVQTCDMLFPRAVTPWFSSSPSSSSPPPPSPLTLTFTIVQSLSFLEIFNYSRLEPMSQFIHVTNLRPPLIPDFHPIPQQLSLTHSFLLSFTLTLSLRLSFSSFSHSLSVSCTTSVTFPYYFILVQPSERLEQPNLLSITNVYRLQTVHSAKYISNIFVQYALSSHTSFSSSTLYSVLCTLYTFLFSIFLVFSCGYSQEQGMPKAERRSDFTLIIPLGPILQPLPKTKTASIICTQTASHTILFLLSLLLVILLYISLRSPYSKFHIPFFSSSTYPSVRPSIHSFISI